MPSEAFYLVALGSVVALVWVISRSAEHIVAAIEASRSTLEQLTQDQLLAASVQSDKLAELHDVLTDMRDELYTIRERGDPVDDRLTGWPNPE